MVTLSNHKQQKDITSEYSSVIKLPAKLKVVALATKQITEVVAHKENHLKQIFQSVSDNLLYQISVKEKIISEADVHKASDLEETLDNKLKNIISNISIELCKQGLKPKFSLRGMVMKVSYVIYTASKSCGIFTLKEFVSFDNKLELKDNEVETALSKIFHSTQLYSLLSKRSHYSCIY